MGGNCFALLQLHDQNKNSCIVLCLVLCILTRLRTKIFLSFLVVGLCQTGALAFLRVSLSMMVGSPIVNSSVCELLNLVHLGSIKEG